MVDVANIYNGFKNKGLQVLWIFGEDSKGQPLSAKGAQVFVMNTGVTFPVLRDFNFEKILGAIEIDGELPHQFILDARTMELVDIASGVAEPAWDALKELLEK